MIIGVEEGTDFNCQWNVSNCMEREKKRKEEWKTKVWNESINRKGWWSHRWHAFQHGFFNFRDQFILKIRKSAGFQT